VTSLGSDRPASAGPADSRAVSVTELEQCDWDDPLTRLLLLLEIADRPAWLRELSRTARHGRPGEASAG
jgi:hypothetical protein